ncbi:MAG: DUF1549 domain-containing protein, partial [Myxococcaceae bacterium]|nr:DUF1549 domain-containing protein [Myxococcaceae bacterium]
MMRRPSRPALRARQLHALPLRAVLLLGLLSAPLAQAQEAAVCAQSREVDRYQLLRRLSVDLRGRVPTIEEYEALDGQDSVSVQTVRAFLADDGFRQQMRRYHDSFLWPTVGNLRIADQAVQLGERGGGKALAVSSSGRVTAYRGASGV